MCKKGERTVSGDRFPYAFASVEGGVIDEVRRIVSGRRARGNFLPREIFGEPAWDILLDLFIASHEEKRISVSSACIASGVPATTALRWLGRMEKIGLIERVNDRDDRRRVYVAITSNGRRAIDHWLRDGLACTE